MSGIDYLCREIRDKRYCVKSSTFGEINIDRWISTFRNNVVAGLKVRKYISFNTEYPPYLELYLSIGVEYNNGYRFCEHTTKLYCSLKKGKKHDLLIYVDLATLEKEIGLSPEEFSKVVISNDLGKLEKILDNLVKRFISNTECDILPRK